MSHNTILFHVDLQQFSQFVLLHMFDSKVVWHLWATIHRAYPYTLQSVFFPTNLRLCGPISLSLGVTAMYVGTVHTVDV